MGQILELMLDEVRSPRSYWARFRVAAGRTATNTGDFAFSRGDSVGSLVPFGLRLSPGLEEA